MPIIGRFGIKLNVPANRSECQFEHLKLKTYDLFFMSNRGDKTKIRSTTVLLVERDGKVAMAGDGQVTLGETVIKGNARKVRRLGNGEILIGFAGATADAFTLLTRFETKLEQYQGQLERSAIELAKDWRTDKYLRNLEALIIVADRKSAFLISGKGDVIASDDGLLSVGSGSMFALAAARALLKHTDLPAKVIAEESLRIAGEICIYTNSNIVIEEL
jgi:ATP-dependent HslUV protease subunit HslV